MLRYLRIALIIWWRLRKLDNRIYLTILLKRAVANRGTIGWSGWLLIGKYLGMIPDFHPAPIFLAWDDQRPTEPGCYFYAPPGAMPMVVMVMEMKIGKALVAKTRSKGAWAFGLWPVTSPAFDGYLWFGPIPDAPR